MLWNKGNFVPHAIADGNGNHPVTFVGNEPAFDLVNAPFRENRDIQINFMKQSIPQMTLLRHRNTTLNMCLLLLWQDNLWLGLKLLDFQRRHWKSGKRSKSIGIIRKNFIQVLYFRLGKNLLDGLGLGFIR